MKKLSIARMITPIVVFLGLGLNSVQANMIADEPQWQSQVDGIIKGFIDDKSIPGLSVTVMQNGEAVFSKAYGYSNVEMKLPATMDTVYPISSVSKLFAGPVVLNLVKEGKMGLDQSVLDYLPYLPFEYKPITIRNLLSHTHGLVDQYQSDRFNDLPKAKKEAMTPKDILLFKAPSPYKFQPGQGWNYSLLGYLMLNEIIETVSGVSYSELVDRYITGPLKMTSAKNGGTEVVVPGRHPVLYELKDGKLINHPMNFHARTYPAGGMNISVPDLVKYFQAIKAGKLLDKAGMKELWTAVPIGKEDPFYALGWASYRRSTGRWVVGHEGGGNAWVYHWPEEKLTVIALSNMSGARADRLAVDVVAKILGPSKK